MYKPFCRAIVSIFLGLAIAACGGGGGGDGNNMPAPPVLSNDASLSSIGVTGVTLDAPFNSSTLNYAATVDSATGSVEITAATTDARAIFTINGASNTSIPLAVGDNTISIVVTAENGTARSTYTITIMREAPQLAAIALFLNTYLMIANGTSTPTLTIMFFDVNGINIDESTLSYELYVNNAPYGTMEFTTQMAGDYDLKIVSGGIESTPVPVRAREQKSFPILTIPIVFHVVHFGEAIGVGPNVLSSEVDAVLSNLNEAFANQKGSSDPNAVDTAVRFRLASTAPDGSMMAEMGINRINGTAYDDGSPFMVEVAGDKLFGPNELWALMGEKFWDPRDYISFFVAPQNNGRGSAALPSMLSSNPLPGLTSYPTESEPYKEGFGALNLDTRIVKTQAAHEIGHVLGLLHPFNSGACGDGDYVDDTYNYILDYADNPGCSGNQGVKESTTIMDYVGAADTFTYSQRERIRLVLQYGIWMNHLPTSTK